MSKKWNGVSYYSTMTVFVEKSGALVRNFFRMCFSKRFDSIGFLSLTAYRNHKTTWVKCGACLPNKKSKYYERKQIYREPHSAWTSPTDMCTPCGYLCRPLYKWYGLYHQLPIMPNASKLWKQKKQKWINRKDEWLIIIQISELNAKVSSSTDINNFK